MYATGMYYYTFIYVLATHTPIYVQPQRTYNHLKRIQYVTSCHDGNMIKARAGLLSSSLANVQIKSLD